MLDFTSSEKRVMFIISIVLIGSAGFQIFKAKTMNDVPIEYHKSDSIFTRRTHQASLVKEYYPENQDQVLQSADRKSKSQNKLISQPSLNINTATINDFTQLPRIGPSIAKRIVAYRAENGPFRSTDELLKVKGIGPKTLERIKPYLQNVD
jgi:comEA protein